MKLLKHPDPVSLIEAEKALKEELDRQSHHCPYCGEDKLSWDLVAEAIKTHEPVFMAVTYIGDTPTSFNKGIEFGTYYTEGLFSGTKLFRRCVCATCRSKWETDRLPVPKGSNIHMSIGQLYCRF